MAEFISVPIQQVNQNQAVLLEDSIRCNKGYVYHRNGSGVVTLRGIVNNPCARFARYKITFVANVAIPTTGTAAEINIGITQSGEAIASSIAKATPTVVDSYENVVSVATVDVPVGLGYDISVDNLTDQPINVQNANLIVTRTA